MPGDDFARDASDNIIGCPKCKSRSLRKDGFSYFRDSKKQQWYCNGCHRKTLKPEIIEASPFTVEDKDPDEMPIEELIAHREKKYNYKKS